MAHNLEIKDGKASFVAKGEKAWHGLGTYVNDAMTSQQVVELANLDYEVAKTPIYINPPVREGEDIAMVEIQDIFATYRLDTKAPLGLVSERYEIVQNKDAFLFFDPIIDRGEAIYETAGVLGNGERVFITAKLPEDIMVAGEKVEQYLLITNGHDGKNAVRVGFTPIRVVCNNTLTAALSSLKNSYTIFHFNNPQERLKEAHKVMGLASSYMNDISTIFEDMANTQVKDEQLLAYIEEIFVNREYVEKKDKISTRSKNLVDKVYNFAKYHPTQITPSTKGTLYGAYNAVSGYFGHIKDYKSLDQRMTSLSFGYASSKTNQAFNLASSFLKDSTILDKELVTI
jgi:phage/plasmid-like protein (TIGR03299 family)